MMKILDTIYKIVELIELLILLAAQVISFIMNYSQERNVGVKYQITKDKSSIVHFKIGKEKNRLKNQILKNLLK